MKPKNHLMGRRRFLSGVMARTALLVVVLSMVGDALGADRGGRRPNVIVIFADDQGTFDLNCYGSKDLCTPHVEALEVAGRVGVDFLVNVTVTTDQEITGVFAGDFERAHLAGCEQGIGSDIYIEIMRRYAGGRWQQFIDDISASDRVEKDQWEYEMQCRVLNKVDVAGLIVATDGVDEATLTACSTTPAPGCGQPGWSAQQILTDQLTSLRAKNPTATWAIIPTGPYILPRA